MSTFLVPETILDSFFGGVFSETWLVRQLPYSDSVSDIATLWAIWPCGYVSS